MAGRRAFGVLLALGLLATACSDSDEPGKNGASATTVRDASTTTALPEVFEGLPTSEAGVLGGTQELIVSGVEPGDPVTLYSTAGTEFMTLRADDLGQARFAYIPTKPIEVDTRTTKAPPTVDGKSLKPGDYRVVVGEGEKAVSDVIHVASVDEVPDPAFYEDQVLTTVAPPIIGPAPEDMDLTDGYNYLEMRDGTLLSAMVRLPDPAIYGEGPYPTVVEMEGYSASNPESAPPVGFIGTALGFATVAVNIRGTGCSGGAFDVFNPAQHADAYDVVEIVARQEWVKGNKVGVAGLSYSGIMTLYAGSTNPPSLAAIAPQSVIPDPWGQQWPGGIYNAGFTKQWLDERDRASAIGGSNWVNDRVESGEDPVCEENMLLRSQNIDFEAFGRMLEFRPKDEDERDLRLLAENIHVPVFITGAFQDEQTGPYWTELLSRMTNAPLVRVRMWNGRHPDGYSPMNIMSWYEFMQLYVNEEVPNLPELVRVGAGPEFAKNFGLEDAELSTNRLFEMFGDDYEAAREYYEAEDKVEVVVESGTGGNEPGEPGGSAVLSFPSWPLGPVQVEELFLGSDGALQASAPADGSELTFKHDPEASQVDFFREDYHLFDAIWDFNWTEFPEGRSLSFLTEPMSEDVLLAGPSLLRLWIGSDAEDADVQVTLSEVRSDGIEYILQSGWLRVGHRAVDEDNSDGLRVHHSLAVDVYEPIPEGEKVEALISLAPVVAPVREGSRLRIQIASPGRNHATWLFESPYEEGVEPTQRVGIGGDSPSSFSLSLIKGEALAELLRAAGLEGGSLPEELPPCPSLRGQACREFAG